MGFRPQTVLVSLDSLQWKSNDPLKVGSVSLSEQRTIDPFLWTVFFKIDGSSVCFTPAGTFSGNATIVTSSGSHGNLQVGSLSVGDTIAIPRGLGFWFDRVQPILVEPSRLPLIPGFFGAIVVVMAEGGNVSESSIEAGHQAFNDAVQAALDQLVAGLKLSPLPDQSTIDALTSGIGDKVHNAVENAMGFWESVAVFLLGGADWNVGSHVVHLAQDQFSGDDGQLVINDDWRGNVRAWLLEQQFEIEITVPNASVWNISGGMSLADPCPAEALSAVLTSASGGRAAYPEEPTVSRSIQRSLAAMRAFRDQGKLNKHPAIIQWWLLATRHSPEVAWLSSREDSLRADLTLVMSRIGVLLDSVSTVLPEDVVVALERALQLFVARGSGGLRRDARRALILLDRLRGKTVADVLQHIGLDPPSARRAASSI